MSMAVKTVNVSPTATGVAAPGGSNREAAPRQVRQWLDAGEAVVIDVREADEHARERIRGSHLVPLSRFDLGLVESLAGPHRRVVLHCKSGKRSADAARLAAGLSGLGVTVLTMSGGIEAWKKEGLTVETDRSVSSISVLRQVQLVVGVCVLVGSALAWWVDPAFVAIPAFFGAGLTFAGASGTCALASVLGVMPWNRVKCGGCRT